MGKKLTFNALTQEQRRIIETYRAGMNAYDASYVRSLPFNELSYCEVVLVASMKKPTSEVVAERKKSA